MKTKCDCSIYKDFCDGDCLDNQSSKTIPGGIPNGKKFMGLMILVLGIFFLILFSINKCGAQELYPVMYGGGIGQGEFLAPNDRRNTAPSLWSYADNFEGADQYIVYKEAHQQEVGKKNHLYLVGMDSLGNEVMKIQIDSAQLSRNLSYCIVTYNGWEIRLRGKLN